MVVFGLAVDDLHLEVEITRGLVCPHVVFSQVYKKAGLLVGLGEPAPALERVADGLHPRAHGNVERIHGGLGELAVVEEAIAVLEVLHGLGEVIVVLGAVGLRRAVALERQPLRQLR